MTSDSCGHFFFLTLIKTGFVLEMVWGNGIRWWEECFEVRPIEIRFYLKFFLAEKPWANYSFISREHEFLDNKHWPVQTPRCHVA